MINPSRRLELEKKFADAGLECVVQDHKRRIFSLSVRSDVLYVDICTDDDNQRVEILVIAEPSFTETELEKLIGYIPKKTLKANKKRRIYEIKPIFHPSTVSDVCEYLNLFSSSSLF